MSESARRPACVHRAQAPSPGHAAVGPGGGRRDRGDACAGRTPSSVDRVASLLSGGQQTGPMLQAERHTAIVFRHRIPVWLLHRHHAQQSLASGRKHLPAPICPTDVDSRPAQAVSRDRQDFPPESSAGSAWCSPPSPQHNPGSAEASPNTGESTREVDRNGLGSATVQLSRSGGWESNPHQIALSHDGRSTCDQSQ